MLILSYEITLMKVIYNIYIFNIYINNYLYINNYI